MKKRLMALFMAVVLMMSLAPAAFAADEAAVEAPAEEATEAAAEAPAEEAAEAVAEAPAEEAAEAAAESPAEEAAEAAAESPTEEAAEAVAEAPAEEAAEAVAEAPAEVPAHAANFLGTNGETVLSCTVGSSVTGSAVLEAYGISGEITALASDSEAVEVVVNEDGSFDVKINGVFADAKLTFTVNGEEIEIPIHDPTPVATEDELKSAISSVGSSTETPYEIQLTDDITLNGNGGITIAKNTNVVIDLNGYTLKNAVNTNAGSQVILNNGTLTIKDTSAAQTGKIQNDVAEGTAAGEWWSTPQYNYATNVISNQGNLIIESGTLEQTASGSICYVVDNNSNLRDAVLTINGGLLQNEATAVIRQFCQPAGKNEVTINGGTVEGYIGDWIQLLGGTDPRTASLTINGGTLSGEDYYAFYDYSYGTPFNKVNYKVNGGEIIGPVFSYGANMTINGGVFSDDVFVYKNKKGYDNTVEINGGFFGGDVSVYDYMGGTSAYYGDALNAGYFKEWYDGKYYYDWCYETIDPKIALENYEPETMEEYPYIVGEAVDVTFVNWDGTELFNDVMAKGHPLYYPGVTPTRPADANYTYEFIGWDKALTDALEKDTVFTAQFKAVPINTGSGETATKEDVITIPVSSEEDVLHYQGKVSGSEVEVIVPKEEEIAEIIAATDPSAPVVVDCTNLGTTIDKVTLPATIIKAVNDNSGSVAGIEVKLSSGSVLLDTDTLASNDVAKAVSITLVLEETEMEQARDAVRNDTAVQAEVGSEPTVIAVVDSYMLIERAVVRTLNGGKAMISIQEDLIPDTGFKVFAMDANGSLVLLEYEIVDGYIRFMVDELQTYVFVK